MVETSLGDRLKVVLHENNITQKELARKLNIAPTTLNGYISNKRQPDLETVKKIAETLGVTTDYLLECEGGGMVLNAKETALVRQLRRMKSVNLLTVWPTVLRWSETVPISLLSRVLRSRWKEKSINRKRLQRIFSIQ